MTETLPKCPFSMSKKHTFEHQTHRVVGQIPLCRWCGLADDREQTQGDKLPIENIIAAFETGLAVELEMRFGDGTGTSPQVKLTHKEIMNRVKALIKHVKMQ